MKTRQANKILSNILRYRQNQITKAMKVTGKNLHLVINSTREAITFMPVRIVCRNTLAME